MTQSYWEAVTTEISGNTVDMCDSDILVIGSGFTGASAAYYLASNSDFSVTMVDDGFSGSYSRNAGHILWGMSEHYLCQVEHWGEEKAKAVGKLSEKFMRLNQELYVHMDGYYDKHAMNQSEDKTLFKSNALERADFNYAHKLSTRGNPIANRNSLVMMALNKGVRYHETSIESVVKEGDEYVVRHYNGVETKHSAVVMCTNAYTKLLLEDVGDKVEPFRGQIIVSERLSDDLFYDKVEEWGDAWSFDNGFIYGQFIDNRVLIGGWRNNASGGENDAFSLTPNKDISDGLKSFVADRIGITGLIWDYEWTGVMASTHNGLPIIKQRSSDGIYLAVGMNGYGHSWGPGCGQEVAKMVLGEEVDPTVLGYFRGD